MAYASLSGSDYFHLLIDRKMKRFGMAGNISRVHFELEKTSDLNAISDAIRKNETFQKVRFIRYQHSWPLFSIWTEKSTSHENVEVHHGISESQFKSSVLNRNVDNDFGLIWIDLCALEDGSKHAVVSMHHALFDHQGMMNFIQALNNNFSGPLFRESEPASVWRMIVNGAVMNYNLFRRSVWKFGSLFQDNHPSKISPQYESITFSETETESISKNAWQAGSRVGQSAFYASIVARALQQLFIDRGNDSPNLWFSLPHNQRRLGTTGHLVSNKLSFLFFKLTSTELESTNGTVQSVLRQVKEQIKFKSADKYLDMMKVMRIIPMPLYAGMVSVPSKGKLSSFGYSDLGEDKLTMSEFCGAKIESVFRYPPVPSPPGFNVATLKKEAELELIVGYGKELISEQELAKLVSRIRTGLLTVQ